MGKPEGIPLKSSPDSGKGDENVRSGNTELPQYSVFLGVFGLVLAVLGAALGIAFQSTFAVALTGVGFLASSLGVVLGLVGLRKLRWGKVEDGEGLAIGGTVVSVIGAGTSLVLFCVVSLFISAMNARAEQLVCEGHLRQLYIGMTMYSMDWEDNYPPADTWVDSLLKHMDADQNRSKMPIFCCPSAPEKRCGYAFNARIDGIKTADIPSQTVLIYESELGWNGSGGAENTVKKARHPDGIMVLFRDGTVRAVPPGEISKFQWAPQQSAPSTEK
ncbi:MAG: hypothetical protein KGZ25_14990 [Planctomycetes bacterium]|nr:hypothetical protein [Planctomycetota bacterium]